MSLRFMTTLFIVLLIGIALGVVGVLLIQSAHLFAGPTSISHPGTHW